MKKIYENKYGVEIAWLDGKEDWPGTYRITRKRGFWLYSPNQGERWSYLGPQRPPEEELWGQYGPNTYPGRSTRTVALYNDFHNTGCRLRVQFGVPLSINQIHRAEKTLCPSYGHCQCGGPLNTRGPQEVLVEDLGWSPDGDRLIVIYPKY